MQLCAKTLSGEMKGKKAYTEKKKRESRAVTNLVQIKKKHQQLGHNHSNERTSKEKEIKRLQPLLPLNAKKEGKKPCKTTWRSSCQKTRVSPPPPPRVLSSHHVRSSEASQQRSTQLCPKTAAAGEATTRCNIAPSASTAARRTPHQTPATTAPRRH